MTQSTDLRRNDTRVDVDGLCWEIADGRERVGSLLDVSDGGLCLERPFVGGPTPRQIQLEFELPGLDEIIWANAHVRFDRVTLSGGTGNLLLRTGLRLAAIARRDLDLIRDYVSECQHRARVLSGEVFDFGHSPAFLRG